MRTLLFTIALAGCTSGGAISGQAPGGTFQPSDAISASVMTSDAGGDTVSYATIDLASTGHLCSDASASPPIERKGQRYLTIELRDVNPTNGAITTAPTAPGTYTIYPNTGNEPAKSASLVVGALDSTCQPDDMHAAQAQSGTVKLTSVTGGAFSGTFDVVLNTGGHLTGSFDPEACPQLATAVNSSQQPVCM